MSNRPNTSDPLPDWARLVQATRKSTLPSVLVDLGFKPAVIDAAVAQGYVKTSLAHKGVTVLYTATIKGMRSLAVVACGQVITHCKALPSATDARPVIPMYQPANTSPSRPGAEDFLQYKSKGI